MRRSLRSGVIDRIVISATLVKKSHNPSLAGMIPAREYDTAREKAGMIPAREGLYQPGFSKFPPFTTTSGQSVDFMLTFWLHICKFA